MRQKIKIASHKKIISKTDLKHTSSQHVSLNPQLKIQTKTMTTQKAMPPPQSCDTFVYIGAPYRFKPSSTPSTWLTGTGTLFGKNSDRPSSERHEVLRVPPRSCATSSNNEHQNSVQCTYICVPQESETLGCILSRPSWMWGCEMGEFI